MRHPIISIVIILIFFSSCRETKSLEELESVAEILTKDSVKLHPEPYTQDDQENIRRLIELTLLEAFKEDIGLGIVDSLSRQYNYVQVDLNSDTKKEILVGLIGPYFCGSGGCTVLLLTNHGDIITQFSVVKYPINLDTESTNGWSNLILHSGGEDRIVKFDGITYPANPSMQEVYSGNVENLIKILDWEKLEGFKF